MSSQFNRCWIFESCTFLDSKMIMLSRPKAKIKLKGEAKIQQAGMKKTCVRNSFL